MEKHTQYILIRQQSLTYLQSMCCSLMVVGLGAGTACNHTQDIASVVQGHNWTARQLSYVELYDKKKHSNGLDQPVRSAFALFLFEEVRFSLIRLNKWSDWCVYTVYKHQCVYWYNKYN